jgi:Zn-dependent protease with chaperone function
MTHNLSTRRYGRWLPAAFVMAAMVSASAQTKIALDPNKYSVQQDVQLGREAAAEATKQLPMLNDDRVDDYVEDVGEKLVAAIPGEFRHPGFEYTFDVINQKEINAFALPGGPMFLNRGMIESAKTEGEMASVMAHEISHVALRHGTAQASKAQKYQIGAIAGQVLGAIVGGGLGNVIAQGSQFGLGAAFMRFGREYERQADLLGSQIMARAGYDPREMANMFKTIQSQGGRSGPEWLSSHPDPGNRAAAINKEAASLRVQGNANTGQFQNVKGRLQAMSPAYTAEQIAKGQARTTRPVGTAGRRTVNVSAPSTRYRTHTPSNFLRVSVPENWEQVDSGDGVTYAPEGGFFEGENGATAFTHGVQIGVAQGGSGNLQRDTEQLVQSFARGNPDLKQAGNARRESIGGRNGLTIPLTNVSEVTGQQEAIYLSTTHLSDGNLLYLIGVAPRGEVSTYDRAFRQVRQSVQIADR